MVEKEKIKHESFGIIHFSRINGNGQSFFGSGIPQNHYITMEINEGLIHRDLSKEWYHSGKKILKLRLTSNQFAELITSLNQGSGVPCTLEYIEGRSLEKLVDIENRKKFIHRKFNERMSEFAKSLEPNSNEVKQLLKKPKLSKEDKKQLEWIIDKVIQETASNIPFFLKCFQEDSDKVVVEAKSEIENAIMQKIVNAGMEKLFEDNILKLKE